MNDRKFEITGRGNEALELSLRVACRGIHGEHFATHWQEQSTSVGAGEDITRLVLADFSTWKLYEPLGTGRERVIEDKPGWTRILGAPIGPEPQLISQINGWLFSADYGKAPRTDGSTGKGWRVYNEAWDRVGDEWKAFVAIEPFWFVFGK